MLCAMHWALSSAEKYALLLGKGEGILESIADGVPAEAQMFRVLHLRMIS